MNSYKMALESGKKLSNQKPVCLNLFAFAIIPFYCRMSLYSFGLIDDFSVLCWGLLADFFWSSALTFVIIATGRGRLFIMALIYPVWALIHVVDLESLLAIQQMSHHSNVIYLLNGDFVSNSLGAVSKSKVLLNVAVFGASLLALLLGYRQQKGLGIGRTIVTTSILSIAAYLLFAYTPSPEERWQVRNFFAHHLDEMAADAISLQQTTSIVSDPSHRIFIEDLTPARPSMGTAKNVLVIVLEGLSGAYVKSVTDYFSYVPSLTMPGLSEIADDALLVPNFVSHRNQTNRGLYSLLCSDYPKLLNTIPKPLEILSNNKAADSCLPRILRNNGYSTHYFQAAGLQFMSKGTVMPFIGFDDVRGKASFSLPSGYYFNWGPDDNLFFEQSLAWIEELQRNDKPWFATLLTVGTHHPYAIKGYVADVNTKPLEPRDVAVLVADKAVYRLIQELKNAGVDDDTLIIITSDESHGVPDQRFGSNWGLMMALAPDIDHGVADDVFGTVDLGLSVLDYLNIHEQRPPLTGRSFFRDYQEERPMLLAHGSNLSLSEKKGYITQCPMHARSFLEQLVSPDKCANLRATNQQLFSASYADATESTISKDDIYYLQQLADARLQTGADKQHLVLSQNTEILVKNNRSSDLLAGQFLSLPHNAKITLRLDLSYEGTAGSLLEMKMSSNDLKRAESGTSFMEPITLPTLFSGERLTLSVSFATLAAFSNGETLLRGIARQGDGVVSVHSYTINIDPPDGSYSPGLHLNRAVISNSSPYSKRQDRQSDANHSTVHDDDDFSSLPHGATRLRLSASQSDNHYVLSRAENLDRGEHLSFNDSSNLASHGAHGFWPAEQWGSWSKSNAGVNVVLTEIGKSSILKVVTRAMPPSGRRTMPTKVFINDVEVAQWNVSRRRREYSVAIPAGFNLGAITAIRFELQEPLASPHMLDPDSKDNRQLGLALESLVFLPKKSS